MEAELQKQMNLVAQLQEAIEEQRAIGLTLEDDVEVLRRRVLEHERGVSMFSRSSQTTREDLEAAARSRVRPLHSLTHSFGPSVCS